MIWSESRRFCFVHIPKTGGTAVCRAYDSCLRLGDVMIGGTAFGESCQPAYIQRFGLHKHSSAAEIIRVVGIENFRKTVSFAVVRDPMERLQSVYRWGVAAKNPGGVVGEIAKNARDFDDFAAQACEHFRPQVKYVVLDGAVIVSNVVAFEHLSAAWQSITTQLELDSALGRANVSPALEICCTDATRRSVRDVFEEDYTLHSRLLRCGA